MKRLRPYLKKLEQKWKKGNYRQAAEKIWGAAALAVKAYALWRDRRAPKSHGELWEYMRIMASKIGPWIRTAWMHANGMHTCFYEGWCSLEDVEEAARIVERLVKEVSSMVREG